TKARSEDGPRRRAWPVPTGAVPAVSGRTLSARVGLDAVAAGALGGVQGGVGPAQQALRIGLQVRLEAGHADADGHADVGGGNGGADAFGATAGLVAVHAGQQQGEFLPAVAREQFPVRLVLAAQALGDAPQPGIAFEVAMADAVLPEVVVI